MTGYISGSDLVLSHKNGTDQITIKNWYIGGGVYQVERLEFADGTVKTPTDYTTPNFIKQGTEGKDNLIGEAGKDFLDAGAGDDLLDGGEGNDLLKGGEGNDILVGGSGDDTLIAGIGSDWLQGGEGNDILVISEDARWNSSFIAYNAGSPGNTGTGERVSISAMQRSHDLFDGGEGLDTARGTDGNDALFLHDTFSPLPNGTGPRIQSIERFNMGAGDDIVDLTSPTYAYGAVELNGEAGNDILWGSSGDDILKGGTGNDRLSGGAGNDRYLFSRGDNQDTIVEQDSTAGNHDTLSFRGDINHDQLWFTKQNNDLRIQVIGTLDQVIVANWYQGEDKQLEEIQATNGQILVNNQIDQLVQAMASFNPPPIGELLLSDEQQQQLAPVLAASWT